jgi:hypothetical protein
MGLFTAICFFGALTWIITELRGTEEPDGYAPEPKRVPDPGSRDLHTVSGPTLGRAHVPSWG